MSAKAKLARRPILAVGGKPLDGVSFSPPLTIDEHVHQIEAIGKRIDGYVRFMCQIASQPGISAEAKERAIAAFFKQMVVVEKQLGRIHDELRLE